MMICIQARVVIGFPNQKLNATASLGSLVLDPSSAPNRNDVHYFTAEFHLLAEQHSQFLTSEAAAQDAAARILYRHLVPRNMRTGFICLRQSKVGLYLHFQASEMLNASRDGERAQSWRPSLRVDGCHFSPCKSSRRLQTNARCHASFKS